MNILVTGGMGFIGSHFIRYLLSSNNDNDIKIDNVYNIDSMGYGSNKSNLQDCDIDARYHFIKGDINDVSQINRISDIDIIVNVAAETHVDRSISDPFPFIWSNYFGTYQLLEYARKRDVKKYIQISTDEVYGEVKDNSYRFLETDPLHPNNPYAATKAAADILVESYYRTYGINVAITRCSNNFGPNQYPEKLIPKTIIRVLKDLPVLVYGSGNQTREWLHVTDHVRAIYSVMIHGKSGEIYNISSNTILTNLALVQKILEILKRLTGKQGNVEFVADRPGHDNGYAIDSRKMMNELQWRPIKNFDAALQETISWYIQNTDWWSTIPDNVIGSAKPWETNWTL